MVRADLASANKLSYTTAQVKAARVFGDLPLYVTEQNPKGELVLLYSEQG